MDEAGSIQALTQQIKELNGVISSLSEGKTVILNRVALDTLALGSNCTVNMDRCSVGVMFSGNPGDLDSGGLDGLRNQIADIGCMLDDIGCQLDDLACRMEDIEAIAEDAAGEP